MARIKLMEQPPAAHKRVMLRRRLPEGFSCRVFVMRELVSGDEITAAINLDKFGLAAAKDSIETTMQAWQREKVRLSLVEVDGKRVNVDLPYRAMDEWNLKTYRVAEATWMRLNGVSQDDLDFDKGGEIVDENEIPPPARDEEDAISGSSDG
jgi:hypothetical protein